MLVQKIKVCVKFVTFFVYKELLYQSLNDNNFGWPNVVLYLSTRPFPYGRGLPKKIGSNEYFMCVFSSTRGQWCPFASSQVGPGGRNLSTIFGTFLREPEAEPNILPNMHVTS